MNWAKEHDSKGKEGALWTYKLLLLVNIDRFLVVLDRSHVKGWKLKAVKKTSSKKRPATLPSFETLAKRTLQVEGEMPTSCPTEDVEGASIKMGLYETIGSGAEPNFVREAPAMHPSSLESPRLNDLDRLMGQGFIDLVVAFDYESPANGSRDTFEFLSLLASMPSGDESNFDIFSAFSVSVAEL